ncbi:hypothetical protein PsYK624_011250 [Phanerochaete sordida]|uniref:Uncharacterized protein n=1 Tax=Phanerochaete sordida TaxID=48140 RepID=A0A9P3L8I5_9APHY|nr:hypothetical protein PsYK624_011250 [Phanerochaete sordida]
MRDALEAPGKRWAAGFGAGYVLEAERYVLAARVASRASCTRTSRPRLGEQYIYLLPTTGVLAETRACANPTRPSGYADLSSQHVTRTLRRTPDSIRIERQDKYPPCRTSCYRTPRGRCTGAALRARRGLSRRSTSCTAWAHWACCSGIHRIQAYARPWGISTSAGFARAADDEGHTLNSRRHARLAALCSTRWRALPRHLRGPHAARKNCAEGPAQDGKCDCNGRGARHGDHSSGRGVGQDVGPGPGWRRDSSV